MFSFKGLPLGVRFSPTNEELIVGYLKKKVLGKRISDGMITELDIYKHVPWDLPNLACLQGRDLIWYFFCPRPEKYGNSGSSRRVSKSGYWKITGRGRPVQHEGRDVGEIKTLMYYNYPDGGSLIAEKTEWTMHEYRLVDPELNGMAQDPYVLSKIFEKKAPGPMNGAEYGVPYKEEEWKDDDDDDDDDDDGGGGGGDKKETEGTVASLVLGPSAVSKNQQGPPVVTTGILSERTEGPSHQEGLAVTGISELIESPLKSKKEEDSAVTAGVLSQHSEGPSCSYRHQEDLVLPGISELIEGRSRSKNQEYSAATGIFERGNHDSGLVFSSADQQISHGYGDVSFMDLVMTDSNLHENAIPASERPWVQVPMIHYDDNAIVNEQLWGPFDNNNDAVQVSEGPQGQSSAMTVCDAEGMEDLSVQGADYIYNGPYGGPDDLFYPKPWHSPRSYIPEYLPAVSTYQDGNILEERYINVNNIWSQGNDFMNGSWSQGNGFMNGSGF